jgi:hypothetical protein
MKKHPLVLACLLLSTAASATPKDKPRSTQNRPPPCQKRAPDRDSWPNGTLLWGSYRKVAGDGTSTVMAAFDLNRIRLGGAVLKGVRLADGKLMAPPHIAKGLFGAILQGADSTGQPVEVALCNAQPDAEDASITWYRIEMWNSESASWKNPCIATARVASPRALAVQGVWDATGAHQDVPNQFTFACENGAIAKCIDWGYKPWAKKDGRLLKDLHQACTRMARADYCGNGRSHTREDSPIDMYDGLEVLARTRVATAAWDPERASFEAAWDPEGASCLARTRDGQALERIQTECPGRFEADTRDLGEGDRCAVRRRDAKPEGALLRNHSYSPAHSN